MLTWPYEQFPTPRTGFYAWANQQAELLRGNRLAEADLENIAAELESMGRGEKRELVSRLNVLLLHLLKWHYQPSLRSDSWRNSIAVQRISLTTLLQDNPSLKSRLPEFINEAYRIARIEAQTETGLPAVTFPPTCPLTFDQLMDETFWPDA